MKGVAVKHYKQWKQQSVDALFQFSLVNLKTNLIDRLIKMFNRTVVGVVVLTFCVSNVMAEYCEYDSDCANDPFENCLNEECVLYVVIFFTLPNS